MNCIYCEKNIPDDSVWCDYCGASQSSSTKKAVQTIKAEAVKIPVKKRVFVILAVVVVLVMAVLCALLLRLLGMQ
jgi:hypothetical protein